MEQQAGYLLDTNVLVALIRGQRLGKRIDARYKLSEDFRCCVISVVTVGEMYFLARRFGWGAKKLARLGDLLDELVWVDLNCRELLRAYAAIRYESDRVGRPIGGKRHLDCCDGKCYRPDASDDGP